MANRIGRFKALFLGGALLAVVLMVACTQGPGYSVVQPVPSEPVSLVGEGDTAQPQPSSDARSAGAYGFSHFFFEEVGGEVIASLVEGPQGEQVRSNLSYRQLKQLYDSGEALPEELKMTRAELGELIGQLDTVRQSTEKYQDVDLALADGYLLSVDEVPNMGAHFIHPERINDGIFDPSEPEFLLYIQDEAEKWELVGTGFVLPHPQTLAEFNDLMAEQGAPVSTASEFAGSEGHPEAFVGPLDNWHMYYSVCTAGGPMIRSTTLEECRELGGEWVSSFGWMIHTYVWEDSPLGVFGMWNPNIPPVMPAEQIRETRTFDHLHEGEVPLTIENFSHQDAQIKVGETLVWTNVDGAPHTVTLRSRGVVESGFDSGFVGPGQSFALRFDDPGEYSYTCTLHPSMNGAIVVTQ